MIVVDRNENGSSGFLINCLRVAARRKWVIGVSMAGGVAVALLLNAMALPRYTAGAVVALDARKVQVIDINSVVSKLPEENAALRTELDAITSRSMANLVADRLKFETRPDLLAAMQVRNPLAVRVHGTIARVAGAFGRLMPSWLADADNEPAPAVKPHADRIERTDIIDWLQSGLSISNDGRSFTIYVDFSSPDPVVSSEIANAFAATYLDDLVGMKVRAARNASTWLRQRLEEMRHELEVSETAVFDFRRSAGLIQFRGDTLASQQISELNTRLGEVRTERARIEARIQNALSAGAGATDSLAEVSGSPLVQALRKQIGDNDAKLADLRNAGAQRNPETLALESQQAALHTQLTRETGRAVAGLKEEAAAVRRQEGELQSNLQGMASRFGRSGESAVRLSQLEREADANRTIYESFLSRYKETIEQEGLTMPEARLLSAAEPPVTPASSGRLPVMLFGLLSGLLFGSALAAFRERIDERVHDIADVERVAAAPVMGVLPAVPRWRPAPELQVSRFNRTPFGEAIQRTGAALRLPRAPLRARVIMVTSASAREGKTSFSIALGRFLAMSGRRVLVIDADFRRPRLGKAFGVAERADTQNVIHGTVSLTEGVQADARSGAHVLTALAEPGALHSHLQGPGWDALVARAREQYDVVILDTPPVAAASDAGVIGACADLNLFLVRWGRSKRSDIVGAIRFLNLCGLTVDGVVLTRTKAGRAPSYLTTYGQGPGGLTVLPGEARAALRAPTVV
jgi:uncharacterized protein involved in exopolysaccharide biosynthesis/Mrp family chromosome partitioning ATPase